MSARHANAPAGLGDVTQLRIAGHVINGCVWGVAVIVMAVSAVTAAELLSSVGMAWLMGLALGLAVDAALVVALVGDRQLHRFGQRTGWGTALRWVTCGMSLVLNCGKDAAERNWGGAVLHTIAPVLMLVLTEAAQSYQTAFGRAIQRAQEEAVSNGAVPVPAAQPPSSTEPGTEVSVSEPRTAVPALPASTRAPNTSSNSGTTPAKPARTARPVTPRGGAEVELEPELLARAAAVVEHFRCTEQRDAKVAEIRAELGINNALASRLRRAVLATPVTESPRAQVIQLPHRDQNSVTSDTCTESVSASTEDETDTRRTGQ